MVKERLLDVTREFGSAESTTWTLSKEENQGLKSLNKRSKDGEIVVVETGKSGKFTLMSQDRHNEAGDEHAKKDNEISESEVNLDAGDTTTACVIGTNQFNDFRESGDSHPEEAAQGDSQGEGWRQDGTPASCTCGGD